jgi:DNA-binding FadR family transcriptional regulator
MLAPQRSATDGLMPLKSGRKSDEVFEQISDSIRAGRFAVGEKLPPERDLASIFQTSRQTIREALYRAELIGLIEVRHGAGSFVVSASPREPTGEPLEDLIRREVHRAAEFFEIRRALEGWCAGQAAKMATRSDLTALRAPLDKARCRRRALGGERHRFPCGARSGDWESARDPHDAGAARWLRGLLPPQALHTE